jgi:hypothetical protein
MKTTFKVLLVSLSLVSVKLNAQWSWANEPGFPATFVSGSLSAADISGPGGGKGVVGKFSGSVALGTTTLTSAGGTDAYLSRINSGAVSWAVKAGGTGSEEFTKIVYSNSEMYAAGVRSGASMTFYGTTGPSLLLPSGTGRCFLAKYTHNGAVQWVVGFPGTIEDIAFSVGGGKVFVTGNFDPSIYRVSTKCFDSSTGALLWTVNSNNAVSSYATGKGVGADNTGNCYVISDIQGTITVGASSFTAATPDVLLTKLDPAGTLLWAKQIGNPTTANEFSKDLDVDPSGNPIITGRYVNGTTYMEPGNAMYNLTNAAPALANIFLARYNTSGAIMWAQKIDGSGDDEPLAMELDYLGAPCLAVHNHYSNTVSFGTEPCDVFIAENDYDNKWYVVKYKNTGVYDWASPVISDNNTAVPTGVSPYSTLSAQVVGPNKSVTEFDAYTIYGNNTNFFLAQATKGECTGKAAQTVGVNELMDQNGLIVFPNPTTGLLNISLSDDDKNTQIIISDNLGREVLKYSHLETSHGVLSIEDLPSGIYFYSILKNNTSFNGKIVKQ